MNENAEDVAMRTDPPSDPPGEGWEDGTPPEDVVDPEDEAEEEAVGAGDLASVYSAPLPEPPETVMERLRGRRKSIAERNEIDIDIPGYDGELVARYRLMDPSELEVIGKKVRRQFKSTADRLTYGSADVLIKACVGIYVRGVDDRLYSLDELIGLPEEQVVYDDRLAEFMEIEAGTARDVVLGVFAGNELALAQHQVKFARWTSDTSQDVRDDFLVQS